MARNLTYSTTYPLVLTRACANSCGYCSFPVSEPGRLPPLRVVRRHLLEAQRRGATQVELIAGEGIANHPSVVEAVRYYGFDSLQSYLTGILQMIEATNSRSHLFSLLNVGPLSLAELRLMRPYLCAVRVMLESADPGLQYLEAHRDAPSKTPDQRLEAILRCGRARVPLTTGIMIGVGESPDSRGKAFEILARAHEMYGHIQAIRLQMFHPVPGTLMESFRPAADGEFLAAVAQARAVFGDAIPIQVSADEHPYMVGELMDAGVTDFGELSVRRPAVNVSHEELLAILAAEARLRNRTIERRFPIHEPFCNPLWYPGGFPHRIPRARVFLPKK